VVQQDPVLSDVKLVAEPWDVGPGGYQVGRFPPPWAEWNDQYRDTVRDAWRGHGGGLRSLAYRLSGSSDLFFAQGRQPWASVNFVTAHDGFSLHDLTAYDVKHNEANGEDGRDGSSENRSWNCGVEGDTDDPAVLALRRRQARNLLTTLLLSSGVPMLTMGDEVRRTQLGQQQRLLPGLAPVLAAVGPRRRRPRPAGVHDRAGAPATRPPGVPSGVLLPRPAGCRRRQGRRLVHARGVQLTDGDWFDASQCTLGMYLDGQGIRVRGREASASSTTASCSCSTPARRTCASACPTGRTP
jgi:glycogen operon protein